MNDLYKKIANKIIFESILDKNEPPDPNPLFKPIENPSPELKAKIDEANNWTRLLRKVNSQEYSARLMLQSLVYKPMPLFSNETRHFVCQITDIFNNPFNGLGVSLLAERFLKLYNILRRTYRAFNLLARIWRIKRIPVRQKTDLYMNELDPTHPNTFQLVQPNGVYYFAMNNLVRIIVDSITNQNGMFVEPLIAKNPYTNTPLTKTEIFNIYFALRTKGTKIPEFLQKFYDCELNIYEFRLRHETELRDYGIKQYVKTAPTNELYNDLCDMLELNKMKKRICVDPGFSKKEFVKTMMPYLEMYFLGRYSFSSTTRLYANKKLKMHLKQFAEKNPIYGKKMLTEKKPSLFEPPPTSPAMSYYTKVNSTFGYSTTCYMQTHIYKDEETFERYADIGDALETYDTIFLFHSPLRMFPNSRSPVIVQNARVPFSYHSDSEEEEDEEENEEDNESESDEEVIAETQQEYEEENDDGSIS